jgi:small subunit ribosomal protein S8e
MPISQFRSRIKATGGLYHKIRKKKKRDIGSDFIPIKIGPLRVKEIRTYGGNKKLRVLQTNIANVIDPHSKTAKKVKIIQVKENPANPFYVRANIITKGAVIETELGLARVVSRPTQHGVINAVLVKK